MKKLFLILIISSLFYTSFGQTTNTNQNPVVKNYKVYQNGALASYYENDQKGNVVFLKDINNERMKFYTYDNQNRLTAEVTASAWEYAIDKTEYKDRVIYKSYATLGDSEPFVTKDVIEQTNSIDDFLKLSGVQKISSSLFTYLNSIEQYNAQNKPEKTYYLTFKGDTVSTTEYKYNSNNMVTHMRNSKLSEPSRYQETIYRYDNNNNLIRIDEISRDKERIDTLVTTLYKYNSDQLKISCFIYNKGTLTTKQLYFYNNDKLLIREEKFVNNSTKVIQEILYAYNSNNLLIEFIMLDHTINEPFEFKATLEYVYW